MAGNPQNPLAEPPIPTLTEEDYQFVADQFRLLSHVETEEGVLPSERIRNVDNEAFRPKLTAATQEDAGRKSPTRLPLSSINARTGFVPSEASHMLKAYSNLRIDFVNRYATSTYTPSSLMMYYVVHVMNEILCESFDFTRNFPDYHPYYLRLYAGILFWFQAARAAAFAGVLPLPTRIALRDIFASHPEESFPVPAPLTYIIKSICASKPHIDHYGLVAPHFPTILGPNPRKNFSSGENYTYLYPNIPGIFALIDDLRSKTHQLPPVYPDKYEHIPVNEDAATFGGYDFPDAVDREDSERWSLMTPGLEYPCEADKRMNRTFSRRVNAFNFPPLEDNDNLSHFTSYMGLNASDTWLTHIKNVGAVVANAFTGSTTLADCAPSGLTANQIVCAYDDTVFNPLPPLRIADPGCLFSLSHQLITSARTIPPMIKDIACFAQTNVRFPESHPYLSDIGSVDYGTSGDFWNISPLTSAPSSTDTHLGVATVVKSLFDSSKF